MTAKITTLPTRYIHVALNSVMFPQILYDIMFHMLDTFYLSSFFPSKLCLELPQNVTWTDE